MTEQFVQHSFKDGLLKLSWYNVQQERKLTAGEALDLSNQLREWALKDQVVDCDD